MQTVHQVSALTGISVRTLHHYDAIGLLKPAQVTEAGYRLYGDEELARLQTILLFRELEFPLKQIKAILASPSFDLAEALSQQIRLLELKKKHLDGLIDFARQIKERGEYDMNFQAFQKTEIDQYAREVQERWGSTEAYSQYQEKEKRRTKEESAATADRMLELFAQIGELRHLSPASDAAQEKIAALQAFITENYYNCTREILRGLGQMYTNDARMKHNIDKAGGEGTADFAGKAIQVYCGE